MITSNNNRKSYVLAWIIALAIFSYHMLLPGYRSEFFTSELNWDILSYYLYLPLTFIYHDPAISDFKIIERIFELYEPSGTFYQAFKLPDNHYVINYMSGLALLYSPFFFIGHLWAYLGGYKMDGFSFPYQFCISNGVYLYILPGIFFLRKLLLKFFSENTVILTMVFLLLGTNYFNEATRGQLAAHPTLFTVITLIILYTIEWFNKPTLRNSLICGLLYGLAVLIRPSEILLLIFPLIYLVHDKQSAQNKSKFLLSNFKYVLYIIFAGFIIFIPQFIYWKYVTGNFIFFSYQNTEGFNFLEPHIWETLFSFKNSWFIYTPIIIFPLIGFIFLYRSNKEMFYAIFIFFIVNFYILSSWLAWWNGGGLGMRYFVESYALLSIPFGYFLSALQKSRWPIKYSILTIMVIFVCLNQFQTWQFSRYIIPHDRRNFKFMKAAYFSTELTPELEKLLDVERKFGLSEQLKNEEDYTIKTIGFYNFETVNSTVYDESKRDTVFARSLPYSFKLSADNSYGPGIKIPFSSITSKDHAWIRISLDFYITEDLLDNPATVVAVMDYNKRSFYYAGFDLSKSKYKINEWNHASFDYLTPYPFSIHNEKLVSYVWLRGSKPIYIDNFHIQALERKW